MPPPLDKKIVEARNAIITDMVRRGCTNYEIAEKTGYKVSSVRQIRLAIGLPSGRKRLSTKEKKDVIRMISNGKSVTFVCKKVGITDNTVRVLCKKHGVKINGREDRGFPWKIDGRRVVELHDRGVTLKQIAKKTGYSRAAILRALGRAGITLRGHGCGSEFYKCSRPDEWIADCQLVVYDSQQIGGGSLVDIVKRSEKFVSCGVRGFVNLLNEEQIKCLKEKALLLRQECLLMLGTVHVRQLVRAAGSLSKALELGDLKKLEEKCAKVQELQERSQALINTCNQ